jgi:hypothetical protein
MKDTVLDGVTYPQLTNQNTSSLKELVKKGGFSEDITYLQTTTLKHISDNKVVCVTVNENLFMFMTTEQQKEW